jgi:hypothetical protein
MDGRIAESKDMRLPVLLLLIGTSGVMESPAARPPREYSVEIRSRVQEGRPADPFYSRLFVSGDDRTRLEVYEADRLRYVVIHRLDRKAVYSLRPSDRTYSEQSAPDLMAAGDEPVPFSLASYQEKERRGHVTLVREGRETVAGQPCDKYAITRQGGGMKPSHLWVATETGLTLQFATTDAPLPRKEWTNLQVGPQAPSLFEIPKGYRKDERR